MVFYLKLIFKKKINMIFIEFKLKICMDSDEQILTHVVSVFDKYQNDWKKLFFLMIHGKATVTNGKNSKIMDKVHKLLISKYPQYKKIGVGNSCIKINPTKVTFWKG